MEEEYSDTIDVEQLQGERDEYLAGWKRAKADLLNYKKEESERAKKETAFVIRQVLKSLLPAIDSMERAKAELEKEEKEKDNPIFIGFLRTYGQMEKFLEDMGVEEIEAVGQFNPEFHEAVSEEEKEGVESGKIIEVLEKGYMLSDAVVRASRVKIAA